MPKSLAQIYTHIVFSTKNRSPLIKRRIRNELRLYMSKILQNHDTPVLEIEAVKDHVHILCSLSKNNALCKIIEEVKKSSSKWIKTKDEINPEFYWQNGYGAFSVSSSQLDDVSDYIRNQEKHHRRITFQEEFRRLLTRYNLECDERYVWD